MLEYLSSWTWCETAGHIATVDGTFAVKALPLVVSSSGEVDRYPSRQVSGEKVFQSDRESFEYVLKLASSDLQYRGFREDRVLTFQLKQEANFLLFEKVRSCDDPHRYEACRQAWELNNRPKLCDYQWSPEQKEAIDLIKAALSH